MKRRLLPALLALVMVLSLLPVAALAADTVNYRNVNLAPLEDHCASPIAKLYDTADSLNVVDRTTESSAYEEYTLDVTYTNLRQHHNENGTLNYWAGVAIPQKAGATYAAGWGTAQDAIKASLTGALEFEASDTSYEKIDGSKYDTFYFGLASENNTTGYGYIAVKNEGSTSAVGDVIYTINFRKTTFAVPFGEYWELATKDATTGDAVVPAGTKWAATLGDWRTTDVTTMGTGVASDELNTDGYIVYAETGESGNAYDVKVLHDGLQIHANGATPAALGWWVGVTFPMAAEPYEFSSLKWGTKTYAAEDFEDDITVHGGPTVYFDASKGTTQTVEITYELNREHNIYKDNKVVVTFNVDLSGVNMLDGKVDGFQTAIDIGTILKQNPATGKTVTNKVGTVTAAVDEEADHVKIGSAWLKGTATEEDNVLAAIGAANYEVEVAGIGKVALDNKAVKDIIARDEDGTGAEIIMAELVETELESDLDSTTRTGKLYCVEIEEGNGYWDIPYQLSPAPTVTTYTMEVRGDFGADPINTVTTLEAYNALQPVGEPTVTYLDVDTVLTAKVDLSFYAGTGLRGSNITVVGIEPFQIKVTNTNPQAAAGTNTATIAADKDGDELGYFVIYEDAEYNPQTGYVTISDVSYLGADHPYALIVTETSNTGGGSSSGGTGGSGSGTPGTTPGGSTAPAQTVVKETVASTTNGTTASANVSSATMDKAVNSAISQAKKAGNSPVVEIEVPVAATAESLEVSLPAASVSKLADADGSGLKISSTLATVELDHTALTALAASAGDSSVIKLEVAPVDTETLTGEQAEAILAINDMLSQTEADADIVDISLAVDGTAVHEYNNGSISVTLPFTLPTGATASDVRVYYLDDDGSLTRCTASYADGKVTFVTNHLSKYIVSAKALLPEVDFADVPANEYYFDAVAWAVANKVTTGTTASTFSPNEGCTRAQIVTFLWRAYGCPDATADVSFTDIDANEYYYDAVKWAVANGITTGTGDGTTFSPNLVCTRAEAVTFQKRAAGMNTMQGTASDTFTDVEAGAFYDSAVVWAVANGITTGTTATTFSPNDYCTRAQIVTFLYRQFGK